MNTREISKYAALVAAGVITEDALSDMFGNSVTADIMSMVGATAVVGITSSLIENSVDTAFDAVDSINPFSW